jgi:molybdopterin molybdotransferase
VIGFPGNPVSTMVCALLFLKPALERMTGRAGGLPARTTARLAVDVKENDQREDYVRSLAVRRPDGNLTVEPHKIQDSSMLSVLSWCNALLIRPPHDPAKKAGDSVQIVDLSVLPGGY